MRRQKKWLIRTGCAEFHREAETVPNPEKNPTWPLPGADRDGTEFCLVYSTAAARGPVSKMASWSSESFHSESTLDMCGFEDLHICQDLHDTRQQVEEARRSICDRGGFVEIVRWNLVRFQVPVGQEMLPVFSTASHIFPRKVPFLLQLPDLKMVLEPFWEGGSDTAKEQERAVDQQITCGPNEAPFCNLKPLLTALNSDMEMFRVLLNDLCTNGCPTQVGLDQLAVKAADRISLVKEKVSGVFWLDDNRSKEEMRKRIVGPILEIWSALQTRNPIECAFQTTLYNMENFGKRCYVCGASNEAGVSCAEPTTCYNELCR